jgi:hypothetical protein
VYIGSGSDVLAGRAAISRSGVDKETSAATTPRTPSGFAMSRKMSKQTENVAKILRIANRSSIVFNRDRFALLLGFRISSRSYTVQPHHMSRVASLAVDDESLGS